MKTANPELNLRKHFNKYIFSICYELNTVLKSVLKLTKLGIFQNPQGIQSLRITKRNIKQKSTLQRIKITCNSKHHVHFTVFFNMNKLFSLPQFMAYLMTIF